MIFKKAWAFFKRDWIENLSYKTSFVLDFFSIFANVLTFFYVSKIFGKGASEHLQLYGGEYFPFVLIGIALTSCQATCLNSFASVIGHEQERGTLESILITPTSLGAVIVSGSLWNFVFVSVRALVYLLLGVFIFQVDLSRINLLAASLVFILSMTSLAGLGIFSAGFILVFKRGDPVNYLFTGLSRLLSGTYFPISILPFWAQNISHCLPLTYSLEAMRGSLLMGKTISELHNEIFFLFSFSFILLPLGYLFFGWAVKRAKKEGSLVFY